MKGYYFITDTALSLAGNVSDVENAVSAGVRFIQYRDKKASSRELYEEASVLREICKDAVFIINDRVDIALSVGSDGVHLGQDDLDCAVARKILGDGRIIGVTVHDVSEARQAEKAGADYVAVGPIFATGTKSDAGKPLGAGMILEVKNAVSVPVVAIGGIDLDNAPLVVKAGADSICAISPVVTKKDVKIEIGKFRKLFF